MRLLAPLADFGLCTQAQMPQSSWLVAAATGGLGSLLPQAVGVEEPGLATGPGYVCICRQSLLASDQRGLDPAEAGGLGGNQAAAFSELDTQLKIALPGPSEGEIGQTGSGTR